MIDTTPLDAALAALRPLLAWLHEPAAEAQLAGAIATLERFGEDLDAHVCEPEDEPDNYYSLAEPAR